MPSRGGGAHTQSTQSTQGNQSARRIDTPREEATTGTVKWFNAEKGYGLITVDGDPPVTVYVHYSAIQMDGHQTLEEGRRVEFVISQGQKGRQADDVRYLR